MQAQATRGCRGASQARPILLAMFIASAMTACGFGLGPERPVETAVSASREGDQEPAPQPEPAQTFPLESVDVERKARKGRSAAMNTASRRAQRNGKSEPPPADEPELAPPEAGEIPVAEAAPAAEWIDPLATEEVATPDLAPTTPSAAESAANPVTLLVVASCGVLGAFLLWRRRRERQKRRRREAWTPIRWGGPRLIRPHWEYDPGLYDSDEFLRRWDSIALSISGDWGLLLAIAGRAGPRALLLPGHRRAARRVPWSPHLYPYWRYAPLSGDAEEHLARWCRLGLSIHGDPREARSRWGQLEWRFEPAMAAVSLQGAGSGPHVQHVPYGDEPVDPVLGEFIAGEELDIPLEPLPSVSEREDGIAGSEAFASASDMLIAAHDSEHELSGDDNDAAQTELHVSAPVIPAPAEALPGTPPPVTSEPEPEPAAPPEDPNGMAWLSRIAPLLQAWEADAVPDTEQALREASRRLSAHAAALPRAARTPWLDAAEALAERVARCAPEASRGAWQAHWIELRLARVAGMSGAWRLLELQALHDTATRFTAPEALAARVDVLYAWAAALLGPAARAKQAEAQALAAALGQVQAMRA